MNYELYWGYNYKIDHNKIKVVTYLKYKLAILSFHRLFMDEEKKGCTYWEHVYGQKERD